MENRVNVQKQSEDREIRVTDLLWKILCSWRLILVCALVCAVLLAGLGSWKSRQGGIVEEMQPSLEELEEKLTEEENEGILKARELQGQIEAQKKYQAESIRMNLDPYAVNEVVFQYYVDTEYVINLDEEIQSDYGDELVWAYTAYVEKNVLQSLLKEKLNWDMDAAYIGELLHAEPANMGNQFTLTVVGVDADQAEELAEQAADVLETYQSTLTDKIGSHKLILLDRSTAVVHDTALADEQTKLDESISAWQTKLDTLTAAFSPAQLQVYEWEDEEEAEAGAVAEATGFSIKYPILGVFAGAFLACVWVALRFILDGKMKNIRELEELYGLCILGELPLENGKKRFLSGIDKRLASLRSKGKQNPEKCREMLLTNLLLACRRENVKELLVTTSQELSDSDCRLLEELKKKLQEKGIQMEFGAQLTGNALLTRQMAEIGWVVLLEKAEISSYTEIEQELSLCAQHQVHVMGAIGLE